MTDSILRLESIVAAHGYQCVFRQNGWWECLLVGDHDRWLGLGVDREQSLRDALRHALPSRLGQTLFHAAEQARAALSDAPRPTIARITTLAPPPVVAALPVTESSIVAEMRPPPSPAVSSFAVSAPPEVVAAAEPVAVEEPPRFASARDAIEELQQMREQIATDAEELALASPRRQRLVMLGWIARARAAQTYFPEEGKINNLVAGIARKLGDFCQIWWPGSVRALKVTTRPEDIVADLTMKVSPPHTWQEACEIAERNLRTVEEEDEARGCDGYGWADGTRMSPPPRDADAMLAEIITEVESLSGPLDKAPSLDQTPEPQRFVEWARKLRWAREHTNDPLRWGMLMGRFRYWIREHGARFAEASRTLDADYSPDRPWAALLGLDPETIARNREIRELFATPPKADPPPDNETFNLWLSRALAYSDTHLAQLVNAMQPFRERVLTLDVGELPGADRRMRRRFSKLQKELAAPSASEMPPAMEECSTEAVIERASDPVTDASAIPVALRDPIVRRTRGKRALFVSNRADPDLRDRLKEIFEFHDLDWSAGETKRRQSFLGPIQSGSYDFVLGATGFLSHSIDGQVSLACRKGNVPYVRVHRGRPLACLRAMARELGLSEQHNTLQSEDL